MASATDNVYVNIIANTQGFTKGMNDALKPLRQFMQVVQTIMTAGGAIAIIQRIARAMGEMEQAYAKLHPETQKAAGSLSQWNAAMGELKAKAGGVVSDVLNPIRSVFLDIIDPIGKATAALSALNKEMTALANKYQTEEYKKFKTVAEAQNALVTATREHATAVRNLAEAERKRAELWAKPVTMKNIPEIAGLSYGESFAIQEQKVAEYNQSLQIVNDSIQKNRSIIKESLVAMNGAKEAMDKLTQSTGGQVGAQAALADAVKDTALEYEGLYEWLWKVNGWSAPKSYAGLRKTTMLGAQSEAFGNAPWVNEDFEAMQAAIDDVKDSMDAVGESAKDTATTLEEEWKPSFQELAGLMVGIAGSLGEMFTSGDIESGIKSIAQQLTSMLTTLALEAAASAAIAQNWPMVAMWLGIAGVSAFAGGALRGIGSGTKGGVELPRLAAGGVVTRPTLAMIGEAGPEAVVPLSRAGAGGVVINVQGSIWQTEDLARAVAGAMGRW